MEMKKRNLNRDAIFAALKEHDDVLKKNLVKRIGLFGSFVRGDQTKKSDIDFLVELKKPSFDHFMDLNFYLENLFGRKVELITPAGLSPYMRPFVEKEIKWYET